MGNSFITNNLNVLGKKGILLKFINLFHKFRGGFLRLFVN